MYIYIYFSDRVDKKLTTFGWQINAETEPYNVTLFCVIIVCPLNHRDGPEPNENIIIKFNQTHMCTSYVGYYRSSFKPRKLKNSPRDRLICSRPDGILETGTGNRNHDAQLYISI